jgi:hypothetical protein
MFGLYLAQGHIQKAGHGSNQYPSFSLHKKRQDLVDRIRNKWSSDSEYDPNEYSEQPSQGVTVMAFDADTGVQFEELGGRRAHNKRIAPIVFQLPREKRLAVLEGWLNGDGCRVHNRNYWQGNTVSPDLASHLALLGESVGYRTNIFRYEPSAELGVIEGRQIRSARPVYHLYFYNQEGFCPKRPITHIEHDGRRYAVRRVKSIERVPYTGDVWNLSVEGNPSFQTAVGMSHNTEKPVELAARAIQYSSRKDENVLDLFGGSGSTLVACEQLERNAFLMEIDALYSDVIVERWQKLTGREATLEQSGATFATVRAERA